MYMAAAFTEEYWLLASTLMRKGNYNNSYSTYNFFARH